MEKYILGTTRTSKICQRILLGMLMIWADDVYSQQYNSASWLSKPHGMVTVIPTFGQRSSMIMNTFSLFPGWEFTVAGYMYNKDDNPLTDDGHSASYYGKYMF